MPTKTSSSKIQQDVVARTASQSSLSSATAIASESLQEMVDEMESQLNHVMSSPVFQPEEVHASHTEEEEKADAFRDAEPPTFDDKDIVKTLDVPRWLGDENVVDHLNSSIKERRLEEEYECTIELFGLETGNADTSTNAHLLITMKGTDTRQLGRVRRRLEDILIDHLINVTPVVSHPIKNKNIYPPSLGRLLYSLALSASENSPRWHDRNIHRTVLGRALLPLYSKNKVWMNIVELPKDEEGNYHGMFLAGRSGRLFQFYREKYSCRVDIYGDFSKQENTNREKHHHASQIMLCEPYVLVTSKEGKSNVDNCLQFIEHRIREHAERFGVSRDREAERLGEQRRMRRRPQKLNLRNREGNSDESKKEGDEQEE